MSDKSIGKDVAKIIWGLAISGIALYANVKNLQYQATIYELKHTPVQMVEKDINQDGLEDRVYNLGRNFKQVQYQVVEADSVCYMTWEQIQKKAQAVYEKRKEESFGQEKIKREEFEQTSKLQQDSLEQAYKIK